MKTTLELPDALFHQAKARAAERGQSLKEFVTEALQARLAGVDDLPGNPPWMAVFGRLKHLRAETWRIQALIDAEFEAVESRDES